VKAGLYQGALERRARAWFFGAGTPAARALRVALVLAPLGVAWALSLPVCPTAALFHVPCPGCGLTRATLALMTGDLSGATAFNPLAVVVCPLLVGATAYAIVRYVLHGRVNADDWGAGWMLVLSMAALTVVWLARWVGYFGGPVAV
jgi:hypothetical protein